MASVDPAVLRKLHEDLGADDSVTTELLDTFAEEAPRLLKTMRDALGSGKASELNRAAHSLKSTAATFGAMHLSHLCRDLEAASEHAVTPPDADARVGAIEREWPLVLAELRKLRP